MEALTFEQLLGAAVVILILIGAYNAVMTAIKHHRDEKRERNSPVVKLTERIDRHDELLAKDKMRLDRVESQIEDMGTQSTIMLRGVRALLSHEINGNSDDKLKSSMSEIDEYLIARR